MGRSASLLPFAAVAVASLCATAVADDDVCPPGMRHFMGGTYVLADGSATVSARPFCLDQVEVTAAGYAACVAAGACAAAELSCSRAATYGDPQRATHPINCVSWEEADGYCRFARKRLPTEAEWEWAARGGARARAFPWGSAPPDRRACWDGKGNALGKGGRKEACPVGTHPDGDSPDGISDLAGNVREWTSSPSGRFRVVRGGSWGDSLPDFLAVSFRGLNAPDERFELTGFRCAAEPLPRAPEALARVSEKAPPAASPARPVPAFQVDAIRIDIRTRR
jgi:sulfatase modifying factor 1